MKGILGKRLEINIIENRLTTYLHVLCCHRSAVCFNIFA